MADQSNSNGPKTVPLKMTSSIPLKKETIRVSVKADPAKAPASNATPPPLPGSTKTAPPAIKTVPLMSNNPKPGGTGTAPQPASLAPDPPKRPPAIKTVPLTNSGSVPTPTSVVPDAPKAYTESNTPTAPPVPNAPSAPKPIKTVPLTNSGSVIVSQAGASPKGGAVKTVPLASAPPAPSMPTSSLGPTAPKPNASVGTVLKTQALSTPQAPNPPGLATQPMDDPKPASFTPAATRSIGEERSTSFKQQQEEVNPNKGWPLAAAALVVATLSLVAHIMGYTIWNQ